MMAGRCLHDGRALPRRGVQTPADIDIAVEHVERGVISFDVVMPSLPLIMPCHTTTQTF
jgi:hypothetical protein